MLPPVCVTLFLCCSNPRSDDDVWVSLRKGHKNVGNWGTKGRIEKSRLFIHCKLASSPSSVPTMFLRTYMRAVRPTYSCGCLLCCGESLCTFLSTVVKNTRATVGCVLVPRHALCQMIRVTCFCCFFFPYYAVNMFMFCKSGEYYKCVLYALPRVSFLGRYYCVRGFYIMCVSSMCHEHDIATSYHKVSLGNAMIAHAMHAWHVWIRGPFC